MHFFPFQSLQYNICKQMAKSSMKGHAGECWALTVRAGNSGCSQGRHPKETLTLHCSIVTRLQGPIPLMLPLSYLCWNSWHYTTRRPARDTSREISESWTNSLRQGGSGETVFPTTVGHTAAYHSFSVQTQHKSQCPPSHPLGRNMHRELSLWCKHL